MIKSIFILLAILLLATIVSAQPDTLWTNTYGGILGEVGYSVDQTFDGGYIVTGITLSYPAWDENIYVVKADSTGNEEWFQVFDIGYDEQGECVQQTSDGGYIITGTTGYSLALDIFLIKTDSFGNQEWMSIIDGGNTTDYGNSCQQSSDGGYIIVGETRSLGNDNYDIWLIKTDASGNEEWNQMFGGRDDDTGYSVQQTFDGGYIIAGNTYSFGAGFRDVYLVKTDSSGREQWSQTYGGDGWDYGFSVQQTFDGGYIIAGRTNSFGAGGCDVYLIKTDAEGNELWSQTFGGDLFDHGQSVQQTFDGGYIIGGITGSFLSAGMREVYVVKTDPDGIELWSQIIGGDDTDEGYGIKQTFDGGYIIAGRTDSYGSGEADVYLIRLEAEDPPDLAITLTPENPPIQIPPSGGTFDFNIEVDNYGTTTIAFDLWTMATLPDGNEYGPIILVENYEINAGQSTNRDRMQYVPMNAPSGIYTYDGYIGNYPNVIWDEDYFEFEKLGGE